jgi:hypothetical protein
MKEPQPALTSIKLITALFALDSLFLVLGDFSINE